MRYSRLCPVLALLDTPRQHEADELILGEAVQQHFSLVDSKYKG